MSKTKRQLWNQIKRQLDQGLKTWAALKKQYPLIEKQQELGKHTFSRWKDPIYYPKVLQLYDDGWNIMQIMKRLDICNPCNICYVLDYNRKQLKEFDLMYINAHLLREQIPREVLIDEAGYYEDEFKKDVMKHYWKQREQRQI